MYVNILPYNERIPCLSLHTYLPYCPAGIVFAGTTASNSVWGGGMGRRLQQDVTQVGQTCGI
jgi:hypothetical protein